MNSTMPTACEDLTINSCPRRTLEEPWAEFRSGLECNKKLLLQGFLPCFGDSLWQPWPINSCLCTFVKHCPDKPTSVKNLLYESLRVPDVPASAFRKCSTLPEPKNQEQWLQTWDLRKLKLKNKTWLQSRRSLPEVREAAIERQVWLQSELCRALRLQRIPCGF